MYLTVTPVKARHSVCLARRDNSIETVLHSVAVCEDQTLVNAPDPFCQKGPLNPNALASIPFSCLCPPSPPPSTHTHTHTSFPQTYVLCFIHNTTLPHTYVLSPIQNTGCPHTCGLCIVKNTACPLTYFLSLWETATTGLPTYLCLMSMKNQASTVPYVLIFLNTAICLTSYVL